MQGIGIDVRKEYPRPRRSRQVIPIILCVHVDCVGELFEIADAVGLVSLLFGFRQRWQQQCRQNGNDRNDYQQFNQRKSLYNPFPVRLRHVS